MATVDLVYASDCPNVSLARANLLAAFARAGVEPTWTEHRVGDARAPARTRGYGSPTILVDGRDVAGQPPSAESSCRIYQGAAGPVHAPTVEHIDERALERRHAHELTAVRLDLDAAAERSVGAQRARQGDGDKVARPERERLDVLRRHE